MVYPVALSFQLLECLASDLARMKKCRMLKPTGRVFFLTLASFLLVISLKAQTTRPEPEKQLAHDIYKQFIEIQSGFTTGSTTPVAQAAAGRLKAAGFSDSDIFLGGPAPKKRTSSSAITAPASTSRFFYSLTLMSSKPSARTGASIPSNSTSATATSTAAVRVTTKRKPPSGSPISSSSGKRVSCPTATSSSLSPLMKKGAVHTTASHGLSRTIAI